jgi:NAD(P)-dependent dehydrogenase (short-subunit alcohol dehydrogenase family)
MLKELAELFNIKNNIAVVTGAASGIGQSIAYVFAALGGRVVAADINEDGLKVTVNEICREGGTAESFVSNITNVEDVRKLRDYTLEKFGRIDALYIVPGTSVRKSIENYLYEDFDKVVNLNLKGTFIVLKEFIPALKRNTDGGSIVLISSIRHLVVEPGHSVYAATKAGVVQLAKTAAAELGKYNIRVNAIAPGIVDTQMSKHIKENKEWYEAYLNKTALKRWASPTDIATVAVFLGSKAASYITGTVIYVDGGWTAIDGRFEPKVL